MENNTRKISKPLTNYTFLSAGVLATLSDDPLSSSASNSGLGPGNPSNLLGLDVVL